MPFFFYDPTFLLLIPALILAIYAQAKVKGTYAQYARIRCRRGVPSDEVARLLLSSEGLGDVKVTTTPGELTDHYDPRNKTLRLSQGVYGSSSLAALGIASHEVGHAIQHGRLYTPLYIRNAIFPVANLGSTLAFPLFFIGLFLGGSRFLMDLGIILYTAAVGFSVITLPVEFNASRRALKLLRDGAYLGEEELVGARKVLQAAALTYVAATCMAILQLVRMLILRGRED
ncbi:MAG: zinc metallopeptidase [bacterium]|nr:zinc metallopeptidase [bacterium]